MKIELKNIKNILKNGTILVEVEKERHAEILMRMTAFHNKEIKAYPHKKIEHLIWGSSIDEIKNKLKKQGVTDVRTGTIQKNNENILTYPITM